MTSTVTDDADLAQQIHASATAGADLTTLADMLDLDPTEVQCRWLAWAWTHHQKEVQDWDGRQADTVAQRLDRYLEWVGGCDVFRAGSGVQPPAWFELVAERLPT